MIHIERVELPDGIRAFAHRDNGAVVVCVSPELSMRERLTAIRQALRAAPAAGWRAPRSPVLFPALLGSLGLQRAPDGRWTYRMAVTGVVVLVAVLVGATVLTGVSLHIGNPQQDAVAPGQPLLTGPGPAPSQARDSHAPGSSSQPTSGTSPRGSAPSSGPAPTPAKTTTSSLPGPAPAASGSPVPVTTTPAPQPSSNPTPQPSPSPSKQSGGSGSCVDVLGVTICL
jgi:hypothetical protein